MISELAIEDFKIRQQKHKNSVAGKPLFVYTLNWYDIITPCRISKLTLSLDKIIKWLIIDNSEPPFQVIAEGFKKENIDIHNQIIFNKIIKS